MSVVHLLIRFCFCLNQEENEQAFQIIEVRILSNWGNEEYTCMYRLRVHGIPSNDWGASPSLSFYLPPSLPSLLQSRVELSYMEVVWTIEIHCCCSLRTWLLVFFKNMTVCALSSGWGRCWCYWSWNPFSWRHCVLQHKFIIIIFFSFSHELVWTPQFGMVNILTFVKGSESDSRTAERKHGVMRWSLIYYIQDLYRLHWDLYWLYCNVAFFVSTKDFDRT